MRRTWVEPFIDPHMISLDALQKLQADGDFTAIDSWLLPIEDGLAALPALTVSAEQALQLQQGKRLTQAELVNLALCRALDPRGRLVALVEIDGHGEVRVRRGFNSFA